MDMSKNECSVCGRQDHLKYCESCKVHFCDYDDPKIDPIGGCFSWASSHEPNCQVIMICERYSL